MNESIPIEYIKGIIEIAKIYGCKEQAFHLENLIRDWIKSKGDDANGKDL